MRRHDGKMENSTPTDLPMTKKALRNRVHRPTCTASRRNQPQLCKKTKGKLVARCKAGAAAHYNSSMSDVAVNQKAAPSAAWIPEGLDAGGMELSHWLAKVGLSRPTGYRYRRAGKIRTHNIEGHEFITSDEIARFWTRAKSGDRAIHLATTHPSCSIPGWTKTIRKRCLKWNDGSQLRTPAASI
jgi:hypothetical protein